MELVVLTIGYEMKILPPSIFVMLVLMTLVTTFMTIPLVSFIKLCFKTREKIKEHQVCVEPTVGIFKVLLSFGRAGNGQIMLPVLCTNGFLIFLPELFGMTGWILLFFILFVLSLLFLHAVTQIPVILKQIRVNKEKKKRIEKQIFIYKQYQEQNILLRRQNHDMNNHLQALSFLLSQNRIDDMIKYIKELLKE